MQVNGHVLPDILTAALAYARRGWRVFPLNGKAPLTTHGFYDATTDERTIRQLWAAWPTANVGIVTGAESGLIVVDIDGECEFPACLRDLPRTITAKTKKGQHLYFKHPAIQIGNRTKIGKLPIDCRGDGGYVVAPPSIHPEGGITYEWLVEPDDCELAEPTAELLDWLTTKSGTPGGNAPPKRNEADGDRPGDDFNQRASWNEILEPHGWRECSLRGRWTRPGKTDGVSATTNHCKNEAGQELLYVFTGNAPPLEGETAYSKFTAHALLNHQGDYSAAAKALAARGFGTKQSTANGQLAHSTPPAVDAPTVVAIIQRYFRDRYAPTFRRGPAIYSSTFGREVNRGEACAAPTSDIIPALLAASDFPRGEHGPKRSAIPGVFRQWAPIAWADMVTALPDEVDSPEVAETAAEQFQAAVADLLLTIESFAYTHNNRDNANRTEVQRRSLIEWARLFAKPGPWQSVRSLALWCRRGPGGQLEVAMHSRLFSQARRGSPYTYRRFAQLCELYDIGCRGRNRASRYVELTPAFLADLLAVPCDGNRDGDGDARTHARTCDAPSPSPSPVPSRAEEGNNEKADDHQGE